MKSSNPVAIVTGADRGIGRAICVALASQGTNVIVSHLSRFREMAQETADLVEKTGAKALLVDADVTDDAMVANTVDKTMETFGRIDVFVSNAGVASRGQTVVKTEIEEARRMYEVHALGGMRFTKLVVPIMREQGGGSVIYISSHATQIYRPLGAPYTMAKAAVEAMAIILAKEERKHKIRVNVVGPGITETEMGVRMVKARFKVEDVKDAYPMMPFERLAQPEDIGEMVAFLASDKGSYINGQTIYVNGGGW